MCATVLNVCSVCVNSAASRIPLNQLAKLSGAAAASTTGGTTATVTPLTEVQPLADVFVPLETIQPGDLSVVCLSTPPPVGDVVKINVNVDLYSASS